MNTPQSPKGNQSAVDKRNSTNTAHFVGSFPIRHDTVIAEILQRLLEGENLTGMVAVYECSTTRLAAGIHYLEQAYGWNIDRVDFDVGTSDGRIVVVKVYYLSIPIIRKAMDGDALMFCSSVKEARAKTRKQAPKAKADAAKRNAARAAAKYDPTQGNLFDGAAYV